MESKNSNFKVIIVGDANVGKTSIIKRLTDNIFNQNECATINSLYSNVIIPTSHGIAQLSIWDTAGTEKFHSLIPSYARNTNAVILVVSIEDADSIEKAEKWLECALSSLTYEPKKMVLVNKSDLLPNINIEKVKDWAKKNNMLFMETSAKTGDGVSEAFQILAEELVKTEQIESSSYIQSTTGIKLVDQNESKSCC